MYREGLRLLTSKSPPETAGTGPSIPGTSNSLPVLPRLSTPTAGRACKNAVPMAESAPYLGAIVHYRFTDTGTLTCLASIVTLVPTDPNRGVGLYALLPPDSEIPEPMSLPDVAHSIQGQEFTWHWPQECY